MSAETDGHDHTAIRERMVPRPGLFSNSEAAVRALLVETSPAATVRSRCIGVKATAVHTVYFHNVRRESRQIANAIRARRYRQFT